MAAPDNDRIDRIDVETKTGEAPISRPIGANAKNILCGDTADAKNLQTVLDETQEKLSELEKLLTWQ